MMSEVTPEPNPNPRAIFWLNFLLFQWLFCRLTVITDYNWVYQGSRFRFAWPLTDWKPSTLEVRMRL
jgi:hypothetical protein